ncbi:hypothetical protein AB6A40_008058 [Gnathostoma spinigerum]|uniref:mannose-6-phosphate isomerase n=1 Tax=Gnathostoma spinigerum TaxID=75299 RepID=A0ABD6EVR3_9BILA
MKVEKLLCAVQKYEWGKIGASSIVACLRAAAGDNFKIEPNTPYAELWMGIHPNGPSTVASDDTPLAEFLKLNPSWLAAHEKETLQFLFKVLSVNKALSIQSHPTKDQAAVLHANDPAHYPDDNHKPEMAIALTDFQLLCGFRIYEEIVANFKATLEVQSLLKQKSALSELSNSNEEKRKEALKCVFSDIMRAPQKDLSSAITAMISRLKEKNDRTPTEELMIRLDAEFPGGDVGVFAPLFLNYFTLKPGEAVFFGPNLPHAYLSGDCIECMACSDNTIRAGLTPKFKDVSTLCTNLTFEMSSPPYYEPTEICQGVINYAPPITEFAVHHVKNNAKTLPAVNASRMVIVVEGKADFTVEGESVSAMKGEVLFFAADLGCISVKPSPNFSAFIAFTPQIERTRELSTHSFQ